MTKLMIPPVTKVTSEDLTFYRQHGWWISPPFLSNEMLDSLKFGVERYAAGERDWVIPVNLGTDESTALVWQADHLSLQIIEFKQMVREPAIAHIAAELAGTAKVRLFHDQLVTKPAFERGRKAVVGWHADKTYWQTCSSANMLTAWIPLDDVPESKGPLAVWDGSHRWPWVDIPRSIDRNDLGGVEQFFRANGFSPDIVFLPMKRGQVSFHHCQLIHGGLENRSDEPRRAYAIHLQDGENSFAPGHGAHLNDLLCRRGLDGLPDYADPDIFPQLWPCAAAL